MAPTVSPSTVTDAEATRCTRMRTAMTLQRLEYALHRVDLFLLGLDDRTRHLDCRRERAVLDFVLRHVDCAFVVGDHARQEKPVRLATLSILQRRHLLVGHHAHGVAG